MSREKGKGVFNLFTKCVPCFRPEQEQGRTRVVQSSSTDILSSSANDNKEIWSITEYRESTQSTQPDYSWASIKTGDDFQANARVQLVKDGFLVGVYDGHGSSNLVSIYALTNIFELLKERAGEDLDQLSEELFREVFTITDNKWKSLVTEQFQLNKLIAAAGSSALVAAIVGGKISLGNIGNSRAVVGRFNQAPEQLTREDNVNDPVVRAEVLALHDNDPDIIVKDANVYRIKGRSQLSKSIGDLYLKAREFNIDDYDEYQLNTPLQTDANPALSSNPITKTIAINSRDGFVIFASWGLWNELSNEDAIQIVHRSPPTGIAATLIRHALDKVAQRANMSYTELQNISPEERVKHHGDMAAVVIFLYKGSRAVGEEAAVTASEDTSGRLKRKEDTSSSGGVDHVSTSSAGGDHVGTSSGGGGGGAITSSRSRAVTITSMSREEEEALSFWSRDLDSHYPGTFSFAVIQANIVIEDYSQVEVGRTATFVGVYDGHGGHQVAKHVCENLTENLMGHVRQTSTMSMNGLRHAFTTTEDQWIAHMNAEFDNHPLVAGPGSCCLVGVIWRKNLYVANVGDSRAIIARSVDGSNKIVVQQLTRDDNVRDPVVRKEVQDLHEHGHNIVTKERGVWRIKGRIQVSKSIGVAYLKIPKFNLDDVDVKYRLNTPIQEGSPVISAVPSPITVPLEAQDKFVIFASDGLWDLMSNQHAAGFVNSHPKEGIAASLIREGLATVVRRNGKSYDDILNVKVESGKRRKHYHDDITVVIRKSYKGCQ